jgi:hypothetical protein
LALSLGLASCTAPAPMQKPGSDNATMDKDTAECHASAKHQAVKLYPYGANFSGPSATGMGMMADDSSRAVAEADAFSSCMQDRGYSNSPSAK